MAEVLFVFSVGLVADSRLGAESPEAFDRDAAVSNAHELSWRNFANLAIGRQMRIRIVSEVSGDVVVVDVELIARKQHQRAEIRRPPDSVILEVVKDVPDGHVVGGEQKFTLFRFPDGDRPIADDAAETIGVPAVEGGSEDGDVGWVGVKFAAQVGNKHFAVVEAAVPCEDESSSRDVRLLLSGAIQPWYGKDDKAVQPNRPRSTTRRLDLAASRTR